MDRIHVCQACRNEINGVKTKIAVPHTCGGNGLLDNKEFMNWLERCNLNGSPIPLHIRYKMFLNQERYGYYQSEMP